MGIAIPDDEDFLELPAGEDDDGSVGTEDAAELAFDEIDDGPEEVGLDTDTAADLAEGAFEIENEDSGTAWAVDDLPIEVDTELDIDGEEHGWTQESEAGSDIGEYDLPGDEEAESWDDGGLEGVDDPMLEGLDEEEPSGALSEEDDEEDRDEPEALIEELARDLSP